MKAKLYFIGLIVAVLALFVIAYFGNKIIHKHIFDELARMDTIRLYQRGEWFYPREELWLIKDKTYYMEFYDSFGNPLFFWEEPEWMIMNNDFILDSMNFHYNLIDADTVITYEFVRDTTENYYRYEKNYTDTF